MESDRHLPEEICDEIVARLPVKSVLRFRSVSKAWCTSFDSERFIKTHLKFSAAKKKASGSMIPYGLFGLQSDFDVVGCCNNGLVCLIASGKGALYWQRRFMLWNPWTRISKELPIGRIKYCITSGFGWDESSGAYKVCAFGLNDVFEVYSSKTNSWKRMDSEAMVEFNNDTSHGMGKFVGGKLHWHWRKRGVIVWFDLKSEMCGLMELPPSVYDHRPTRAFLGEHEGCLCVVSIDDDERLDVWVMKKESWFRMVAAVPLVSDHKLIMMSSYGVPFSFLEADGRIWLAYGSDHLARLYLPVEKEGVHFSDPHLGIQSLVRP